MTDVAEAAAPTVTVTITVEVDPTWIYWLTTEEDFFRSDYSGYWARGVEWDGDLGWLLWENDEKCARGREPFRAFALEAWRANKPLPTNWHRLNKAVAIRAWAEGVKSRGTNWYKMGDAGTYDDVVQRALFGEVRYG